MRVRTVVALACLGVLLAAPAASAVTLIAVECVGRCVGAGAETFGEDLRFFVCNDGCTYGRLLLPVGLPLPFLGEGECLSEGPTLYLCYGL